MFLTTGHGEANLCCPLQTGKGHFPKKQSSRVLGWARRPQKHREHDSSSSSPQSLCRATKPFCSLPGVIKSRLCWTQQNAGGAANLAFPSFLSSLIRASRSHDYPRLVPFRRFKLCQHSADALSHPVFASLPDSTHLHNGRACKPNVSALPWDFCKTNI